MKVVYACYGGAHSSPVAAAVHLGWLPTDRVPEGRELLDVPRFDRTKSKDHGLLEHMGRDDEGHDVYVIGRGPRPEPVERALASGYEAAGGDPDELYIVRTLSCVNGSMRVGGYLSRSMGWVGAGRPVVLWGTRRAYKAIVQLVFETKEILKAMKAERN